MNILSVASSAPALVQATGDYLRSPEYQLLNSESYEDAITFTSCMSIDLKTDGEVVSTDIEEGSFMTYNRAIGPDQVNTQLAIQGSAYELQNAIESLKNFQTSTQKLCFVTPYYTWMDFALESFDFSLKTDNGIGILYVDLVLLEIREVEPKYSDTKPITSSKSAGAQSSVNKGKQQAKTADPAKRESILHKLGFRV